MILQKLINSLIKTHYFTKTYNNINTDTIFYKNHKNINKNILLKTQCFTKTHKNINQNNVFYKMS